MARWSGNDAKPRISCAPFVASFFVGRVFAPLPVRKTDIIRATVERKPGFFLPGNNRDNHKPVLEKFVAVVCIGAHGAAPSDQNGMSSFMISLTGRMSGMLE